MALAPIAADRAAATSERMALRLERITKRWPGAESAVLDRVGLTVEPGSTVFVGGANGVGKTTLLRIAAGLILPDAGHVRFGPLDAERDRVEFQRRVGFLSAASAGLYARLTVRDHLRLWSRLALIPRGDRGSACGRVIDVMALEPLLDHRVDRLSMGQRQRVRLAGALLHGPDVVLLDEPVTSLDDDGLALLAAEVERVRARGGAVVWCAPTSHAERVSFDRRVTISAGRLEES
jgi:ABC-type multidrug transport system ATPase subunit